MEAVKLGAKITRLNTLDGSKGIGSLSVVGMNRVEDHAYLSSCICREGWQRICVGMHSAYTHHLRVL